MREKACAKTSDQIVEKAKSYVHPTVSHLQTHNLITVHRKPTENRNKLLIVQPCYTLFASRTARISNEGEFTEPGVYSNYAGALTW